MRMWKTISSLAIVVVVCASAAQAQARYNGFSVVLLLGDSQGSASSDGLPPAAGIRKALADVKDFLPYKSYKMLDSQWLRGGETRMKGLDDQEYDVEVSDVDLALPSPVNRKEGRLNIYFRLQESGAAMNSSEEFGRSVQAAEIEKQLDSSKRGLKQAEATLNGSTPGVTVNPTTGQQLVKKYTDEIARYERQLRLVRARKLIDSHFEMMPGETVVVGTSKIGGGDKGLVVLLTAVPAGGK